MSEHVELEHLVDVDIEYQSPPKKNLLSLIPKCRACPYLGIALATLSSLFFSLCSVIVKGLVEVKICFIQCNYAIYHTNVDIFLYIFSDKSNGTSSF